MHIVECTKTKENRVEQPKPLKTNRTKVGVRRHLAPGSINAWAHGAPGTCTLSMVVCRLSGSSRKSGSSRRARTTRRRPSSANAKFSSSERGGECRPATSLAFSGDSATASARFSAASIVENSASDSGGTEAATRDTYAYD